MIRLRKTFKLLLECYLHHESIVVSGVRIMGTSNSPSSERADTSESLSSGYSTSYSGILPLPLSKSAGWSRNECVPRWRFITDSILTYLNWTCGRVEALVSLFSDEYPTKMHFLDFMSSFCLFLVERWTYAMLPNTLRCDRVGLFPAYTSWGVSSCAPVVVHRFMM